MGDADSVETIKKMSMGGIASKAQYTEAGIERVPQNAVEGERRVSRDRDDSKIFWLSTQTGA